VKSTTCPSDLIRVTDETLILSAILSLATFGSEAAEVVSTHTNWSLDGKPRSGRQSVSAHTRRPAQPRPPGGWQRSQDGQYPPGAHGRHRGGEVNPGRQRSQERHQLDRRHHRRRQQASEAEALRPGADPGRQDRSGARYRSITATAGPRSTPTSIDSSRLPCKVGWDVDG
jgi:hypothetical protein